MSRLARLLHPQSIAIVGATDRPGSYAANTIGNLQRAGFGGRLVGVHPERSQALGVPCVPSLAEAGAVDAVVIATPAASVPDLVHQASLLGCGGAIAYAAGFAEAGRADLQQKLLRAAGPMPVIGPNGNGVVAVAARAPMWGDDARLPDEPGNIGLVTESGNIGVIALGHRGGLGLRTVVSTGNSAVVSAAEVLTYLANEPGIAAVALYLESDGDGQQWCDALAACAERDVHVVALKTGRSTRGAAVGAAHTAAIVGDHGVFAAMVTEAGGTLVAEPGQLLETARALASGRRDPRDAAIVTCSGADAAIAADLAADLRVRLADLLPQTVDALRAALPEGATASNPLDHTALLWADEEGIAAVTEAAGRDAQVGHLMYVQDEPAHLGAAAAGEWLVTRQGALLGGGRAGQVPMLVATTPGQAPPGAIEGLGNALRAIHVLQQPAPDAARIREIGSITAACAPEGREPLDEYQAKELARRHGIEVPAGELAQDAEQAVRAALLLGWPVALKAVDPSMAHKSERGAVILGLTAESEVRLAARRLLELGTAVLVEQQVPAGIEVLVAARSNGVVPTLTVGLGGIWAEALRDVAVIPLPATAGRIRVGLDSLAAAAVLHGGRGQPPAGLDELCHLAERVGHLLIAGRLHLVEANPVIVGPGSAIAVDLLIR
ncbi:MAG: acetate--CoA ligase family protein [Actinomycetales bacterium]|nr:acetate--CoA ligase family protein [Actinomycetales bacterium]